MPDQTVPVTWVPQEELYYCGPAVAQMTLGALGVAPPALTDRSWQDVLWEQIKDNTDAVRPAAAGPGSPANPAYPSQKCEKCSGEWQCWSATPLALRRVLNNHETGVTFSVNRRDEERQGTILLTKTIDRGIPGIALVYGWGHWLVVDGYRYDDGLEDGCDLGGRTVDGFYLRNSNASEALHFVSCATWHSNYLSYIPCGQYTDDVVVLSAIRSAEQIGAPESHPQAAMMKRVSGPERRQARRAGSGLLEPEAAAQEARRAAVGLLQSARWKPALSGASTASPLIVQRLDREDSYYYIVPFTRDGSITARLIVNAMTGRFEEAAGVERAGEILPPFVEPGLLFKELTGARVDLPGFRARVVRPGMVGEHPVLVWRPCRESTSPFLPFYLRTLGSDFLYLRVDGQRFTQLTAGPV
jgi:hypothetical protein